MQTVVDLNTLTICADGPPAPLGDWSTANQDGTVQVYFRHLRAHLLAHVGAADIVVGCVAWLTDPLILGALALKDAVSIIVQKEDFLRPDMEEQGAFAATLRQRYEALPGTLTRWDCGLSGTQLEGLSACTDPTIEAVRCVGNANRDHLPAFPRSHHKFVVLCRRGAGHCLFTAEELAERASYGAALDPQEPACLGKHFTPYAVWTGSFNFTVTAGRSFENALLLTDPTLVAAYFQEYGSIAAVSEPLDWKTDWSAPQWRIGT